MTQLTWNVLAKITRGSEGTKGKAWKERVKAKVGGEWAR